MADWREHVLREFTPGLGKAILVADPDRLFTDPTLSEVMTTQGFDLFLFEDSVPFRFAYESKYRSRLDRGQLVDLVVLYQGDSSSPQSLPYDLLARRNFTGGGTFQPNSQRKTLTVDQYHPLCPLAPLGFTDREAPFFAGAKLPSK
jgi:hypothetical protein